MSARGWAMWVVAWLVGSGAAAQTPTDGLLLWLDASAAGKLTTDAAGRVEEWRSSVTGPPLVSEGEQRPHLVDRSQAGLPPVVRFDGQDDVLRCLDFARATQTWTLLVRVAPRPPSPYSAGLVSARPDGGHDYDPGLTVDLYDCTDHFNSLSVEGAGRIGGQMDQLQRTYPYGPTRLIIVERDLAEIRLRVEGKPEATRVADPAVTQMGELRVGARFYDGGERHYLRGDIAEVLLYDRVLPAADLLALEASRLPDDEARLHEEDWRMLEARREQEGRMAGPEVVTEWPNLAALEADIDDGLETHLTPPLSTLPVRTDVIGAASLGVRSMTSMFDRDRDDEPYFYANLRDDGTAELHHSINIGIPHVVGRALWACMAAEELMGVPFPEAGLAVLERYLKLSFDNEHHLNSYVDPDRGGERFVEFHNMREGLYGLVALIMGRDSTWAREKADLMLQTLASITDDTGRWSPRLVEQMGASGRFEGVSVPNAARMVDPLLAYYRLTGSGTAFDLAGKYARAGAAEILMDDGTFGPMERSSGHVHSITSSLSGITEYAIMAEDDELLAVCLAAMEHGVPEYFSSWGWGDEVYPEHPADVAGRGEINQTGDVIRTALHLGALGRGEYYEMAERYLRSMVLPTQHTEETLREFARDVEDPQSDARTNVLYRAAGGFSMQLPNDRMRPGDWPLSTVDITSGAVHAMAECWQHRCTMVGSVHRVNLLLSYEDERVTVESMLPLEGRIIVRAKTDAQVDVRLPSWMDPASLVVRLDGQEIGSHVEAGYLKLPSLGPGTEATVSFPVHAKRERETVDGTEYTTIWAGSQVLEVLPRGPVSPLPF
ncbi:MAG: hypothetical protein GF320_08000 [Armatimonadia bacterium]|nr:hypothetical protein [Armatimonadia bacterium]